MDALSGPDFAGRPVDANRGVAWWTDAWALFMREPAMWIVFLLIDGGLTIVLSWFPLVGVALSAVATTVFRGGWMLSIRKVQRGERIEVSDLFAGFSQFLPVLAILGLAYFAIDVVVDAVLGLFGLAGAWHMGTGMALHDSTRMMTGMFAAMTAMLLSWLFTAAIASLLWFSVPLVVLDGQQPVDALRTSVTAVLRNVGPFLVFGLIGLAASLVIVPLTLGLALLVLLPLGNLAIYLSWQDVFGAGAARTDARP